MGEAMGMIEKLKRSLGGALLGILLLGAQPSYAQSGNVFPDERAAAAAFAADESDLNRIALAMVKHKYALQFYNQYRDADDADALRQSLRYLASAREIAPDSPEVWRLSAAMAYDMRDTPEFQDEAIASYTRLLALEPTDIAARLSLIDLFIDDGQWEKAVENEELLFLVNMSFAVDTVLDRMVYSYINAGLPHRGIQFFTRIKSLSPNVPAVSVAKAMLERSIGDHDASIASLAGVMLHPDADDELKTTVRKLMAHWQEAGPVDDEDALP